MRPKGSPKTIGSGRKAGTPNKNTMDLMQKCADKGVDIFDELLLIAMTTLTPMDRFRYFSDIAQYIYPKRKALEVDANVNMDLAKKAQEYSELPKEEQIQLMEEEIKRLKAE